jgi:hypothetical protein
MAAPAVATSSRSHREASTGFWRLEEGACPGRESGPPAAGCEAVERAIRIGGPRLPRGLGAIPGGDDVHYFIAASRLMPEEGADEAGMRLWAEAHAEANNGVSSTDCLSADPCPVDAMRLLGIQCCQERSPAPAPPPAPYMVQLLSSATGNLAPLDPPPPIPELSLAPPPSDASEVVPTMDSIRAWREQEESFVDGGQTGTESRSTRDVIARLGVATCIMALSLSVLTSLCLGRS